MDKYIKIKELEEVSGCKIEDIKELTSGKVYVIGVEVGDMNKDLVVCLLQRFTDIFENENIKAIMYPICNNTSRLTIHEIESKVKDISYMYQSND